MLERNNRTVCNSCCYAIYVAFDTDNLDMQELSQLAIQHGNEIPDHVCAWREGITNTCRCGCNLEAV